MPLSLHRRSLLVASTLGSAFSGVACSSAGVLSADAERYIAERSGEWTACFTTGDTEVMERILASDFVNTSPRGIRSNKAEAIVSAKQGPEIFASTRMDGVIVKVYGSTALALGSDIIKLKSGAPAEVRTAWTDTWLFRDGAWQVVASHECVVRELAAQ